jgi:hypothetical protein
MSSIFKNKSVKKELSNKKGKKNNQPVYNYWKIGSRRVWKSETGHKLRNE